MTVPCTAAGPERPALETHLRRFAKSSRKRLRKLAKTSPRLGDLLYAFPGAAVALATGYGGAQARAAAVRLVKEGAPLARTAEALGLPMWLRRLPPEAFDAPLPDRIEPDADFDRRIVNLIPEAPAATGLWLELTLAAHRVYGAEVAVWLAGQAPLRRPAAPSTQAERRPIAVRLLGLYAWTSGRRDLTARRFMLAPWNRRMALSCAVEQTRSWLERAVIEYCRREDASVGRWTETQRVGAFSIAPRLTPEQLEGEGRAMENCVATYAGAVAAGHCLIYAIRRGGQSVATLEIRANADGQAYVAQLSGRANGPTPDKVPAAVRTWLSRQKARPPLVGGAFRGAVVEPSRWDKLWTPVWDALGPEAGPPRAADQAAFLTITRELAGLTRLAQA